MCQEPAEVVNRGITDSLFHFPSREHTQPYGEEKEKTLSAKLNTQDLINIRHHFTVRKESPRCRQ